MLVAIITPNQFGNYVGQMMEPVKAGEDHVLVPLASTEQAYVDLDHAREVMERWVAHHPQVILFRKPLKETTRVGTCVMMSDVLRANRRFRVF